MDQTIIYRKNFRIHLIEGALYLSTHAILYAPIFMPALILKLGGSNVVVGAFPVMVYLAFLLPQLLSPLYVKTQPLRKPMVLSLGWVQRFLVLFLAVAVGVWGQTSPSLALVLLIVVFTANQVVAGIASPAWFDLVAKTTKNLDRGKLMGMRTSIGALIGLIHSSILTVLLTSIVFPMNYSVVIVVVFCFQVFSLLLQKGLIETDESKVEERLPVSKLYGRLKGILQNDPIFRRFLASSALLTIGLAPVGFYMVAAISKFRVGEAYIGWFTLTIVLTQIVSGVALGTLADRYGHRTVLIVCGAAVGMASIAAVLSTDANHFFIIFILVGMNLGAEMMTRYNFAVECASEHERPMYVGMMNAWLAPWYAFSLIAGWAIDALGFDIVFVSCSLFTLCGLAVLIMTSDPRSAKLALSSK